MVIVNNLATIGGTPVAPSIKMKTDLNREETLARLLREELRTLERSYPEFGKRQTTNQQDESGQGDASAVANHSVEQNVPEETKNNRVSEYDPGRSLSGRAASSTTDMFPRRPQPPFYTGSEHLAEKPALPPHVLKARSGDVIRVRSRSRPVYKPLYSSSEHLAARPAIPLPQLEAYQNSKDAEQLVPYLEEDTKVEDLTTVATLLRLTPSSDIPSSSRQPPKVGTTPSVHVKLSTPSFFPETTTGDVREKPVFFHANQDELLSVVTTAKPSTTSVRTTTTTTTTVAPSSSVPSSPNVESSTTETQRTNPPLTRSPTTRRIPTTRLPSVTQAPVKEEKPTRAPDTPDTPTNLYLPDTLVLSNQHSRPQFPRYTPAAAPSTRSTPGGQKIERRTTRRQYTTTRSPLAFPPRRRMTFQPFKRTTRVSTTTTTETPIWQGPSMPALYAGGDAELLSPEQAPAVRPVPDMGDVHETTKNLLISTEPTVHADDNIPEVPDTNDEENREDHEEVPQSPSMHPAAAHTDAITRLRTTPATTDGIKETAPPPLLSESKYSDATVDKLEEKKPQEVVLPVTSIAKETTTDGVLTTTQQAELALSTVPGVPSAPEVADPTHESSPPVKDVPPQVDATVSSAFQEAESKPKAAQTETSQQTPSTTSVLVQATESVPELEAPALDSAAGTVLLSEQTEDVPQQETAPDAEGPRLDIDETLANVEEDAPAAQASSVDAGGEVSLDGESEQDESVIF